MSIARRIKREARNNPAKAALLVGLLGLAFYSWAPLVAGWLGSGDESPRAAPRSEQSHQPEQSSRPDKEPTVSKTETNTNARPSWAELRQWRQDSPWTLPVELTQMRDPFCLPPGTEALVDDSEENDETPRITPKQTVDVLEIQLTGTIVGPRRRVALLGGRAYHEGDVVLIEHLGTTWELEIRRIEAKRVKLGWQSIERIVTVPERRQVGRIEIVDHAG